MYKWVTFFQANVYNKELISEILWYQFILVD